MKKPERMAFISFFERMTRDEDGILKNFYYLRSMTINPAEIKYPVGVQSFEKLRDQGYLYVDKTAYVNLVSKGNCYFLSRPRRFGKSLFLSTLEAYYQGRRDLFKGLALDSLTEDWDPHPVLHLDLTNREYKDRQSLVGQLNSHLERWEAEYGGGKADRSPEERFADVIRKAYDATGKRVVVLVDEYDKPLLNAIDDEELADDYRSLLKAFYSNLKTMDRFLEMAFLTGVARFSKVSIFSDLNNLRDISFADEFAGICGITSEELERYFEPGIAALAAKEGVAVDEMKKTLVKWYDGYHFSKNSPDIYNPFSLVNAFANLEMGQYWINSGTPYYLVKLIERGDWMLRDISPVEIDAKQLEAAGIMSGELVPSLYQTGYLTIKEYDRMFQTYTLDYPNAEVRDGFLRFLVPFFIKTSGSSGDFSVKKFIVAVNRGDIDGFMRLLESMLAGVPYSEKGSAEGHFQNAAFILFTLMGQYVRIEDRTSDGRIDLTVETPHYIYIFEFKVDSTAEEAMGQILRKKYWLKYLPSRKEIRLIGADFDTKKRRLSGWIVQDTPNEC